MEDKKRKKEDKRKREASQKVAEQKNKVPELTKPTSAQCLATPGAASPSPGPGPSSSPSPATAAAGAPSQGGNNAKRPAVANGQPPAGAQTTQRYMPREVPPRFRSQQDHKVLLKRGQPPLSCMLLAGGNSGSATSPLSLGDNPSTTVAAASDSGPGSSGSAAPSLHPSSSSSLSSVAASCTISSSNYANSTWGASSGSQPLSQGWEKVIVDGSDLEEWPSIGAGAAAGDGAGAASRAPWSDRHLHQRAEKGGRPGTPSPPSSSSSPNECAQLGSSAWGGLSSQAVVGGGVAGVGSMPPRSKASAHPGNPGANFNPNANPSAWPALVQDGAAAADGGSSPLPNSSSLSANPSLSQTPPSGNTVSHQHQVHQVRNREPLCGDWGGTRLEQSLGPKKAGLGAGDETDCGGAGGGDLSTSSSSSSASSSCRVLALSSNPKTGASRTDTWEDGEGAAAAPGEGGNLSGYSSQDGKGGGGVAGGKAWEAGSGSSCKASGVSQGEWGEGEGPELSIGEWDSSVGEVATGGSGNLGTGGGCSSSASGSSSSGGSIGNPATPSPAVAAAGNFDNQKGAGDGALSGEWGGQGKPGGSGTSSSCSGGHSRAGGGTQGQNHGHTHNRSHQPSKPEVALQNLLNRTDLDPRVLSNSGWGQTQIRQNVAWDLEGGTGVGSTGGNASGLAATYPVTTDPSAASRLLSGPQNAGLNSNVAGLSNGDGWDSGDGSTSALPARVPLPSSSGSRNPGAVQGVSSGGSAGASGNTTSSQGKLPGGWGGVGPPESFGKGWSSEGQDWRERRGGTEPGGWGDFGQQGTIAGGGGSGWGGSQDEKGTGGWKDKGKETGGWGPRSGGDWEKREAKAGSGGWGEGKGSGCGDSDVGMWSNWDEGGSRRGWEVGSGSAQPPQLPNSQASVQQQQSQIQLQDTGATLGGWGRPGGLPSQNQNQSPGWTSGPIPQAPGGPSEGPEPSGWEEPSPQSLSRRMEIDDGTSAWGDPSHYNYKSVNLWDKNGATSGLSQPLNSSASAQSNPQQQQQQATGRPTHQPAVTASRDSNPGPARNSGMGWGSGGTPSSPSADNGTAAWGKPTDAPSGWGDLEDAGKPTGWGNPSASTGSKSMQDGWGEGDCSVSASRHSSWEEEEEPGGVWSSTGSQGSNSSYNSGGWGQGHGGKKGNSKGALKGGSADSWMNPMTRQFSNMGLLGEDPGSRTLDLAPGPHQDKKLDGEKRGMSMNDYNGEMRKGGRGGGGGGGTVFRSSSSKEVGPSEPGPYYDKMGGHNVFGSSGGMAQSRGTHQPGVSPINLSPSIRAQVPQQFLSPQVPGSVLKQMPPPSNNVGGVGGVGSGVFPAHLSPQHIAMLSSIYPHQIQFQLACQLLLQQQSQQPQQQQQQQQFLQNQRKFPQNIRQQPDPQQLARIMAVFQQQRQQQVGLPSGSSKLSPSHLGGGHSKQPVADSLPHPGLGGSLVDQLNPKTQGGYPGFGSGVNIPGMEMGLMAGGPAGAKEGGQQSRFKWMMEGHSPTPSPPESGLHKNGPISAPVKLRESSPYSQYESMGNDGLAVPPQGPSDNWHRTPGKMGNKTGTSSWPPEFQPGVPWKGFQSADPESDPYVTPGSVLGSSTASSLSDTEHQLLRDNTEPNPSLNTLLPSHGAWPYSASSDSPLNNAHNPAKYTEYKPSWPPDPIGHNKLWKATRNSSQLPRPPPGLTHQKQQSLSPWSGGGPRLARGWGGSSGSQETRYGPGSAWSDGGTSRNSCWLLLSNLTPQIDGSTLRTICMQHGPLLTFHLGLTQGSALIRYSSRQEAAKAQSALHMCVLGNTTILAEFVSEEEVSRYFAHSQVGGSGGTSGAGVTTPSAGGGQGPPGTGTVGANSGGSTPGNDRERERPVAGGGGTTGGSSNSGGGVGSLGPPCTSWQGLDGTGSSPDPSPAQGPGLSMFVQWSSNSGGGGGVGTGGVGSVEPGRQVLWGGMTPGYPSSNLWGASPMEDQHQMGSPAALLPGDLLGGGTDSI